MKWPFSRKHRELKLPPEEEQRWGVAQGNDGQGPLVVRYNQSAAEWAGHPDLPVKLGFAIPLNRPNEGGLPDPSENAELIPIEELISGEVTTSTLGVHALTLTTGVVKEFVFYVAPDTDVVGLHERVQERVSSHEVQCIAEEERKWQSYRAFTP